MYRHNFIERNQFDPYLIYIPYLSVEDFGILDLINQITNIIVLISCLEISQGLARYFYDTKEKKKFIFNQHSIFLPYSSNFIHIISLKKIFQI